MIPQGTLYAPQGTRYAPQGTRRAPSGSQPGTAPSWVQTMPSTGEDAFIDLDFVNQRYWGGSPAAFITGTLTIDSNGLLISAASGNKNGTAAAVAAFGDAWTCYMAFNDTAANDTQSCLLDFDATDAPIFILGPGGDTTQCARSFRTNSAGSIDTLNRFGNGFVRKVVVCRDASGRAIAQNGTPAISSATPHSVPAAIQWFRYQNAQYATGYIERMTIWKSRSSDADTQTLSGPRIVTTPYAGANCIRGEYNQYCSFGANTLQYERTQPWTVGSPVKINAFPSVSGPSLATMVFCNVSAAAAVFPGYEGGIWPTGKPFVRIINNIDLNRYIEVQGSSNLIDNQWHFIWFTYDGSSTAAGVKIYVDGVLQTLTVISDTLGTNSIIGGTQTWVAGSQFNRFGYYNMGFQDQLCVYNVAKDATFAAAYSSPGSLPPIDSSCQIWCDFNEALGTTVIDYSGNGRNGTLTASFMRVT